MSNKKSQEIRIKKMNKEQVTLNIKLSLAKEFKVRMWIATRLMMLGALILGCGIEFIMDEDV